MHFILLLFLFKKGCWRLTDTWRKNVCLVSLRCKEKAFSCDVFQAILITSHVILLAFDFQWEELHCIFLLEKSFTLLFLFRNNCKAPMFINVGRKFLFWQVCSWLLNGMSGLTIFVLQAESSFSEEEEEKLQIAFSLEKQDLHLVLETISFILEQVPCFYHYELINIFFFLPDCRFQKYKSQVKKELVKTSSCSILCMFWGHDFTGFVCMPSWFGLNSLHLWSEFPAKGGRELCMTPR